MGRATWLGAVAFACLSCSSGEPKWDGTTLFVDVPPTDMTAGQEITDLCFSMDIGNATPLYVNSVTMHAMGGIHHSNWEFVPTSLYRGPDGIWPCADRSYDQSIAALAGGVLFAQSTQATDETMQFETGAAVMIPAHSRIVSNLHFLNATSSNVQASMTLHVRTIPADQAHTLLHAFAFSYSTLDIPPHGMSQFTTDCDLSAQHMTNLGRPVDFHIHYVLPHYHAQGTHLDLQVIGGPHDGVKVWETNSMIGEPLGGAPSPPFDMTGATGLRLTCVFDNPRDNAIHYGNGDGEMCIAFGYTDSPNMWASSVMASSVTGVSGGVTMNNGPCVVLTAPGH